MKGFKNKKGISLIVLVITIIVMIILAAAIILSLNNSGIIGKANKAKKDSDAANLKEYVNVLQAEWELMTESEKTATGKNSSTEYVNEKLGAKYPDAALAADGEVYSGLNKGARKAIVDGIRIGDTVTGYTLDTSKSSKETSGKENTAPDALFEVVLTQSDNPQRIYQTPYSTWKYIGIGENGELLIAPDMPESIDDNQLMKLSGKGGYLNGPTELDNVCKALYSTDKGTARSMKIEDINRILEYTPPEATKLSDLGLTTGQTPDGTLIGNYYNNYYSIALDIDPVLESLNTGKKEDTDRKRLLLSFTYARNESYWLASRICDGGSSDAVFDLRLVSSMNVACTARGLFYSTGNSCHNSHAIRPAVCLNPNVQLTKQTVGSWSI